MITIPKQFNLLGFTITVEATKDLRTANGAVGCANYDLNSITLQEDSVNYPRLRTNIEQTYLHEIFHWIFHCAHRYELAEDEELIDVCSGLLHQILTTSKGELKINAL